jgi:hypothetical protein
MAIVQVLCEVGKDGPFGEDGDNFGRGDDLPYMLSAKLAGRKSQESTFFLRSGRLRVIVFAITVNETKSS